MTVEYVPILLAISPWTMAVVALIALLLFGNRLPSVARSLGRGITQFKKGLSDKDGGDDSESQPPATRADNTEKEG